MNLQLTLNTRTSDFLEILSWIYGTAVVRKHSWKTILHRSATISLGTLKCWFTFLTSNLASLTRTCITIRVVWRQFCRIVPRLKYFVWFTKWTWCKRIKEMVYSEREKKIWRDWACHWSVLVSELAYGMKLCTGNCRKIYQACFFFSWTWEISFRRIVDL